MYVRIRAYKKVKRKKEKTDCGLEKIQIRMENVSKSYDGRTVLAPFNFEIQKGSAIAIVGQKNGHCTDGVSGITCCNKGNDYFGKTTAPLFSCRGS